VLLKPKNQQVQQYGKASNTKAAGIIIALVVVGFRGLLLFLPPCLLCNTCFSVFSLGAKGQVSGNLWPKAKNVSQRLSATPPKNRVIVQVSWVDFSGC